MLLPATLPRQPVLARAWIIQALNRMPLCCHCATRPASRPRGLCWRCYYGSRSRSTRKSHKSVMPSADRPRQGKRTLPPKPTTALPGTIDKIAVMAARFAAGYELWHPGDATEE